MFDALYISAIGLQAQKEQLDALASNLANVSTTGFKRQSVDFTQILDRARPGLNVDGVRGDQGSPMRLVRIDMSPGDVHATGRNLDIAIPGAGFLVVALPGDKTGYSRAGALQIAPDGALSVASGHPLKADIRVPAGASDLRVMPDGSVVAKLSGDTAVSTLGQLELARFANPELLEYHGEGIYTASPDSDPVLTRPGEDGSDVLVVQSLEGSNIRFTDELVSLMILQRIYELNSRVAQVTDEMIGMSNNLRHG